MAPLILLDGMYLALHRGLEGVVHLVVKATKFYPICCNGTIFFPRIGVSED